MNDKRKVIIAGNWKMNKTCTQTKKLLNEILMRTKDPACEVVVCTPFVSLECAVNATKDYQIQVGAQNVHFAPEGAYTGEISTDMLKDIGVKYVIVGHSERRQYFGETDETVNKRLTAAVNAGLTVILCVGETRDQREYGVTNEVIRHQIKRALFGLSADEIKNIVIAYEPVWAIGTGLTATSKQAQEVCALIRATVKELFGLGRAKNISILYGGSMKPSNAAELLNQKDIDGGLIGGAALNADDFCAIIDCVKSDKLSGGNLL